MYDILLFVVMKRALHVSRRVGMADDADSKSVGSNPVWVQVPPPAVKDKSVVDRFIFLAIAQKLERRFKDE